MPLVQYLDMQIAQIDASAPSVVANARIGGVHADSAIPAATPQAMIRKSHNGSLVAMATPSAALVISARES